MTIGTRIDSAQGTVSTNGTEGVTVERNAGNKGFAPFQVDAVVPLTTSSTLTAGYAGVNTISGSSALTQVMPLASSCPGAMFTFRNLSAHAHVLTGSQETGGTTVFVSGAVVGSKVTMAAAVGNAVLLKSDGVHFFVVGGLGNNPVT